MVVEVWDCGCLVSEVPARADDARARFALFLSQVRTERKTRTRHLLDKIKNDASPAHCTVIV